MERQILHIDVNNAFLSWTAVEMLKNGSKIDIREIPAVIGGDEERRAGIVLAKSMPAKMCGVKTAETIYMAKKKCNNLQVFSGLERKKYREYSDKLYNLLSEYTDIIERFSIDECFLDMTNYLMNDSLINKAYEIHKRVKNELGFTVNIGIAHNKLLAKMASDFEKPDKVHTLFENEVQSKMWKLPISELFMIGKKTVPKLYNMRIKTIGDLAKTDKQILIKKFGKYGILMWEYANGIDKSEVNPIKEKPKSVGNSVTLSKDLTNIDQVKEVLIELIEQVSFRLRKYNLKANTVSVQLRTKDFKDFSHQKKMDFSTSNTKFILNKSLEILNEMYLPGTPIRLVGARVDNLESEETEQLSMFNEESKTRQDKIDKVLDKIKNKYGYDSITRAGTLKSN